ncbi:4-hydroxyphenylpyruvate dioxygenase [Alteromonas aestuariivivens]|uniref:4-hydroxyphenylpyruvate dioxygenase n=1 Tax=Alteromonas aestuariivivens TaxID=1938339 RepID=A0A3D8MCW5_9ALTE|nr:4-hydroxyphenylpyruvate dioxygenase [Alteromonas aestuariivivens]RDV28135.1 4-hydroxyphenylpyruvate dioxygenase [Alteromonas aestuariivivens]
MGNLTEKVHVLGLSFIEFSGSEPEKLRKIFDKTGLNEFSWMDDSNVTLHVNGGVRFISNPTAHPPLQRFRNVHGRGVSAIAFMVDDSEHAFALALRNGAERAESAFYGLRAIKGVGESFIYFIDAEEEQALLKRFSFFQQLKGQTNYLKIDHLTHNLFPGGIQRYKDFYNRLFGFTSLRSFDINGAKTGLISEVVANESRTVIIPLNETKDDKSQIAEYLRDYGGEGVQHIALLSANLEKVVEELSAAGIEFQDTPDTYYDLLDARLPDHKESVEILRKHRILLDGGEKQGGGYLLQIFTKNSIGPIFFEFIQRKGNDGFGEGNFQALFESIELDQERRGVI